jgi:hypothetical protein
MLKIALCFKSNAMLEVLPDVSYTQRTVLKRTGNKDVLYDELNILAKRR